MDRIKAIREAVKPVISVAIRQLVEKHLDKKEDILAYLSIGGEIFCEMAKNGTLSPAFLSQAVAERLLPKIHDELALAAVTAVIVIYNLEYGKKPADVSEQEWAAPIAKTLCQVLDEIAIAHSN